jgi:hypothetical protein
MYIFFIKRLGRYFVQYIKVKKVLLAISKLISAANRPFSYIPAGLEGLYDFFDSLHHHPLAGQSPANSQHTKQL